MNDNLFYKFENVDHFFGVYTDLSYFLGYHATRL